MDITEFIAARLAEEEANTLDALALWPETHFTIAPGSLVIVRFHRDHDPARVLREVAAKRKRLATYLQAQATADKYGDDRYIVGLADGLADTIKDDTAVYSDHPDYRAEWTP